MTLNLIFGILCTGIGILGWYEKSTATLLGITTWKVNLVLGVINLLLAVSYLFPPQSPAPGIFQ